MNKAGIIKKAALMIAVMLILSGCQGLHKAALEEKYSIKQVKTTPKPILFLKDREVHMACGNNVLKLEGAQVKDWTYLRGELSGDNSTLYYIRDFDETTKTGTLMAVKTDCASKPYKISKDVSVATVSPDGSRALFLKNISDGKGDLYEYETGYGVRLAAESAIPEGWGFSPNSKGFYCTMDDCYDIDLHKMHTIMVQSGFNYYMFDKSGLYKPDIYKDFYLGDDGRLQYNANGDIYVHDAADKSTELANEASVYRIHGGVDDFLYYSGDELWYKTPDKRGVMLSEKSRIVGLQYTGSWEQAYTEQQLGGLNMQGDRLLIAEKSSEGYSLYDQSLSGEKTLIANADSAAAIIDHYFNDVLFVKDKKVFITHRTASGWSEPETPEGMYAGRIMSMPVYDSSDSCYYYVKLKNEHDETGTFCRVNTDTGKIEELMQGADFFNVIADIPYVYTKDGLYRISGSASVKINESVGLEKEELIETAGGVFLVTYENIYYLPEDSDMPQTVCLDTSGVISAGGLDSWAELPEDAAKSLKELYEDAIYYVGWMAGNESTEAHRSAKDDGALAQELFERSDLTSEAYQMLIDFSAGFLGLGWRMEENDVEKDEAYYKPVVDYLNSAIAAYEERYES